MITNKKNRYFHVTPKKNLQSILSNGLLPQIGERSAEIGEPEPCIFLFPIFEEMDNALYNWLGEAFKDDEELVILQIDVPENFPIHQEKDSNGDDFYEAYCKCRIPGEYITAVYDESYQLIKGDKRQGSAIETAAPEPVHEAYCKIHEILMETQEEDMYLEI